jgi:hypothetical protein
VAYSEIQPTVQQTSCLRQRQPPPFHFKEIVSLVR